jgi:hypothetical protein
MVFGPIQIPKRTLVLASRLQLANSRIQLIRQEPESVLSRISTHKQSCHRLPRFLSMITSAHPAGVNGDLVG